MSTIREFANQEFEEFVHKNDLEVFSKSQVNQFVTDAQSVEDEFEKHCITVDLVSLTKGIVINDDLTKSIVYYRPSQVEPIEGDQEFGSILKSKNLQYKDTPINRIKGIVGLPVNKDIIEKARKAEPIGTEKTYGGKLYIKTEKGWRLKSKGLKTDKEAQEKKFIENLVDAAKKYGKDSVQFQSAMLAPKNAYKNDNDMNRFLVKLSNELSSKT